ncbi:MAG TPA: hypothetical protein VMH02_10445 [Verrucomicrobiae bacterium]|nr:hypothetical protein [Verrucomicrobiae bacterium]
MNTARYFSALLAASFAVALPTLALAQTSPAPAASSAPMMMPEGKHGTPHRILTSPPLKVTNCSPKQNNYVASGFTPAYYPGGPYWGWPSVYGPAFTYYQYPVQGNPTLAIDYTNATGIVMKQIEFGLIARGELVAEVRDVGTFSPGAEIKHEFGLNPNVFPLHTGLAQCVPLKITFDDGTKWINPHLPALRRQLYQHPH